MDVLLSILSCCRTPKTDAEKEAEKINKNIEQQISRSKRQLRKEQKILLLGTGECGKSTFIKQMRIILGGGFPDEQYDYYKLVIHKNLLQAGATLAAAMRTLNIPYADQSLVEDAMPLIDEFDENNDPKLLNEQQISVIKRMWADSGVQDCYDRRREFQLLDSAKYFLTQIDTIVQPGYRIDVQDILRSRVKTTGIIEEVFSVDNVNLKIIDVGGQRRERRKWIHSFEGVTSVIFLASLSEYDMVLEECKSKKVNRTEESLQLFSEIIKYPWFRSSSFILFLNKKDQFAEKLPKSNLADYFPDYTGEPENVDEAQEFVFQLYKTCWTKMQEDSTIYEDEADERFMFKHFTCATDTENIKHVYNDIRETLLCSHLKDMDII